MSRLIHAWVGVLLLAAAGLKIAARAGVGAPTLDPGPISSPLAQGVAILWELLLGVWLLSGAHRRFAWYAADLTFAMFAVAAFRLGMEDRPSCGCLGPVTVIRDEPYMFQNWPARLLPYLEQSPLWDATVAAYRTAPGDPFANPPHVGYGTVVKAFLCPADGRLGSPQPGTLTERKREYTSYLGVNGRDLLGYNGLLFVDSRVRLADVHDGTSQTVMVGERPPTSDLEYGAWYAGKGQINAPIVTGSADAVLGVREVHTFLDSTYSGLCPSGPYWYVAGDLSRKCDAFHFWSLHPGGANFAFADGSVQFLSYSADSVLPALATRAGGEVVALPD